VYGLLGGLSLFFEVLPPEFLFLLLAGGYFWSSFYWVLEPQTSLLLCMSVVDLPLVAVGVAALFGPLSLLSLCVVRVSLPPKKPFGSSPLFLLATVVCLKGVAAS
jgi:hypothetical protein